MEEMESHEFSRDQFESEADYRLYCLRHSCAHILAQAVQRLHPATRLAIGPPIKDGFYYDIDIPGVTLSEADLPVIEAEMKKIVKENQRFQMVPWPRDTLLARYTDTAQVYKLELMAGIPDDPISVCENTQKGDAEPWIDLCRGNHVDFTGRCKHFRLLRLSGAYWRGDATRPQLQRIYGTAWPTKDELETYLFRLEEAKKRDHRKLGKELELFMFHDVAAGAPFWLPRGEHVYHTLSEAMRTLLVGNGYSPVRTPMLFDKSLWETSGHWEHYQENMFHFAEGHHAEGDSDEEPDSRIIGLKPMNCPSHMLIFRSTRRSYRELPLRIHDQGVLHRNELRGALGGLTRVRQLCQDDAHIFCTTEQIESEMVALLLLVQRVYGMFGLGFQANLSTRPEQFMGAPELWDAAEAGLRSALEAAGLAYKVKAGDGAFYGPKIDFEVLDALDRAWQCATIQLDFQLPQRFELKYVGTDNTEHAPVVIHRAIFGSFERFIGILIEHWAGNFPMWLSPEQVRVMTVSEKSVAHGSVVHAALKAAGLQATFDDGDEKIGKKIRDCHAMKVNYMAVIGERELEEGTVSVRSRDHGDLGSMSVADFVARLSAEAKSPIA